MRLRYLSYPLTTTIPTYGSTLEKVEINKDKSIEEGDSCRTYWIGFNNHWGTHVDCPAHFDRFGKSVEDYDCTFWEFSTPQVVQVNAKPGQIIKKNDLKKKFGKQTDLLMLKSGWSVQRGSEIYSCQNPGLDPEIGHWLRTEFPNVRAVGIDWISISSFKHRKTGREAHRSFLAGDNQTTPIVLIEDMDLAAALEGLAKVLVVPLRVEKIDSAPCTVIGFFNDF